jgi:hypothetical protein
VNAAAMDDLRRQVRIRTLERFGGMDWGIEAHTGEEYEHSNAPQAVLLRERKALAPFLAFTFQPWTLWELHVGCVPLNAKEVSIGLHVGQSSYRHFRDELDVLAQALNAQVRKVDLVDEVQCNMPTIDIEKHGVDFVAGNIALLCSYAAASARRATMAARQR